MQLFTSSLFVLLSFLFPMFTIFLPQWKKMYLFIMLFIYLLPFLLTMFNSLFSVLMFLVSFLTHPKLMNFNFFFLLFVFCFLFQKFSFKCALQTKKCEKETEHEKMMMVTPY